LAIAALLSLWGTQATALSLGRIIVQSSLGEPLRAEIDILDINTDEAASLRTKVAQPDAFKAQGLDYNPALNNLQTKLLRRPDGRMFLSLSGDRPISDPFVDMILETSWNTGRIVRDYTMLFDPPSMRVAQAAAPVAAQLPAAQPARTGGVTAEAPKQAAPQAPFAQAAKPAAVPSKPAMAPTPAPAAAKASPSSATVTVKTGDTAGKIAAANKPSNVSLDQMLVAMLRANPDAFIQDNVNRIKAGAILTLPTEEQAAAEPQAQATQTIVAQSQDFNEFRRKFAGSAPLASVAPATRVASGKVQTTIQDKKPPAATPDKLTLSKGAVAGKSNEDKLAQARNTQEAAARTAELAKNIADLGKLAAAASTPVAAPAAPVVTAPVSAPAPSPVALPAAAVASAAPASAPEPVKEAASAAPSVAVSAPAKPASAPPKVQEPAPEPSFIDGLLENPLLPVGGAALVGLLAALGIYKSRQRKRAMQVDSSFVESSLAESFSGASGGQNVDTSDDLTTGSSMVYSPSQLDAADDVDPVAEADVYLAYGRDLQAEEILKDALRSNPQRVAIHQKLLEIYAKRRDTKSFESIAALAFNLTDGTGPEWEQICERGLSIDPDNALYLPGGQPVEEQHDPLAHLTALDASLSQTEPAEMASEAPTPAPVPAAAGGSDLDLDLDFSLDDAGPAPTPAPAPEPELAEELIPTAFSSLDSPATLIEPELPLPTIPQEPEVDQAVAFTESENVTVPGSFGDNLDFPTPLPQIGAAEAASLSLAPDESAESATEESASPASSNDLMSFDLGSLSLDLGEGPVTQPGAFVDEAMDPLETKLALADEFRAIGDDDGARALIEEVIAEATGDLKTKAQNALAKL